MVSDSFYGSPEATTPGWLDGFNSDLSRLAWDQAMNARQVIIAAPDSPAARDLAPLVLQDGQGHVTSVDKPDGTSFEYSKFDRNGQPTEIKMKSASGTVQDWRREGENLWRQCDEKNGHPYYRVLRGNYSVDKDGNLLVSGKEDYMAVPGEKKGPYGAYPVKECPSPAVRDLQPLVLTDEKGRVTSVDQTDGTKYDYSKFDANGQPTVIKITGKDGDYGYWKKEGDHLWRGYDKEKPGYSVLKGDWVVDRDGQMHSSGDFTTAPLPVHRPVEQGARKTEAPKPRATDVPPVTGVVEQGSHKVEGVKPGPEGVLGHPPAGCKGITGPVPKAVALEARKLLSGDWGTETTFTSEGKTYVARVEPHAPDSGINHWHKGVSVFEKIN